MHTLALVILRLASIGQNSVMHVGKEEITHRNASNDKYLNCFEDTDKQTFLHQQNFSIKTCSEKFHFFKPYSSIVRAVGWIFFMIILHLFVESKDEMLIFKMPILSEEAPIIKKIQTQFQKLK